MAPSRRGAWPTSPGRAGPKRAAHRLKIIHRDLKPDNILIVEGPDGVDRVKVVDFGIAKAFGAGDGNLTKTGFVVGTPEFMSPEQLMGATLDARSDVYALALVAFQCLTNALPFRGDTPEMAMTARLTAQPCRLEEIAPAQSWPAAVQAVACCRAIESWVAGQGAGAAGSAGSSRRRAVSSGPVINARNRWTAIAGVAAVLAVAAFSATLPAGWCRVRRRPRPIPRGPASAQCVLRRDRHGSPAGDQRRATETAQVAVSTPDPVKPAQPRPAPVTRPPAGTGTAVKCQQAPAPLRARGRTPPAAVQPRGAGRRPGAAKRWIPSFVIGRAVDAAAARAVSSALRSLIQRLGVGRARAGSA
jgi:serine/threonine-protein kinase